MVYPRILDGPAARGRTMNDTEYADLYAACHKLDDGPDYRMNNYALNLINTVLDFQLPVNAVNAAMCFYQKNIGYSSHRGLRSVVDYFPNTSRGNKQLSSCLWDNNMWTRAKFLRVLLDEFEARDIRGQQSLTRWLENAEFEQDVKGQFRSSHHSMGIAIFHWLCLRCGIDTIKPDTRILQFVATAIGRRAYPQESLEALVRIAHEQGRKARLLDSAIWNAQGNL